MAGASKKRWLPIALPAALLVLSVLSWLMLYPHPSDPKSLFYQAWKLGIPLIKVETAYEAMIGDPKRLDLVKGRSLSALKRRFGNVRREELLPYQEYCFKTGPYREREIAFLGDSKWMVLFENGTVIDLILCKGI